jgi:DNA-binding transcriptional ArsR family regulator
MDVVGTMNTTDYLRVRYQYTFASSSDTSPQARAPWSAVTTGPATRLRLLELLAAGERCVSDIATSTGDAMPTVSQRLQLLRREGLLRSRRDGKHVFYALADAHVLELIDNVLRHAAEASRRRCEHSPLQTTHGRRARGCDSRVSLRRLSAARFTSDPC